MHKPRIMKPPRLRKDVALQVADVAGVPSEDATSFVNWCKVPRKVWELDRRAVSSKAGRA